MTSTSSFATPVYLHLDSRFPSGHHPRGWLEEHTRAVEFQQWLRVETKDQAYGWLPEDHLVTPLKLASQALVTEDTPLRMDARMDSIGERLFKKGEKLKIVEIRGSWLRARALDDGTETWLPTSALEANFQAPALNAYLPTAATVYVMPGTHPRVQTHLRNARFVRVLRESGTWLEIRYGSAGSGYIRRADAVTLNDLGPNGVQPLLDLAPLRSAPLPYADTIRALPTTARLRVIAKRTVRWGQAKVADIGEAWWPMTGEADEDREVAFRERVTTGELFKRKIFDMASSPAVPALKFLSAQGVYRTTDGVEWSRIPFFKDQNYPIAIAGAGAIFVGPYLSDDNGETFQQWIRLDNLVGVLRRAQGVAPSGLRILEIRPQDASGRRVILKVVAGPAKPLRVSTEDQGISWHSLSF